MTRDVKHAKGPCLVGVLDGRFAGSKFFIFRYGKDDISNNLMIGDFNINIIPSAVATLIRDFFDLYNSLFFPIHHDFSIAHLIQFAKYNKIDINYCMKLTIPVHCFPDSVRASLYSHMSCASRLGLT